MTEHKEMAAAIESQDMAKAERLARAHTDLTRLRFKAFLSEGLSPTRTVFGAEA